VAPDTLDGIEKYLASGIIKGIGPGFAKRIVKYFGLESLRVLDTESHRLGEVPGLGKTRIEELRRCWQEHRALSNVLLALQSHGASPALAAKIVERFGQRAAQIVEKNPYRLSIEISGIGFKTADRIARSAGLSPEHPERAQAGVLHEMRLCADAGHCFCPRPLLRERAAEMLSIDVDHVEAAIDTLWMSERLVVEEERVFLSYLYQAERSVAERVNALVQAPSRPVLLWQEKLEQFEKKTGLLLAPAQRRAVAAVADEKFVVITGGPGVGKTTLVRAILDVMTKKGERIRLAAPTGRAAKRMTESTGMQAQTLHRLLEVGQGGAGFARNADNPLEVDLLIVDEASMIDINLAKSLLVALPDAARLVVVGDADQLPSVGPGAFLHDLIACEKVFVARLDVIFRQDGQSGIVENSHAILAGREPIGAPTSDGDFFVVPVKEPAKAAQLVAQIVCERIPARFQLDPIFDVQVLSPMHRGDAGTIALNELLQHKLNPRGQCVTAGDSVLRVGDKVLQTRNDYSKEVFNGDLGQIVEVEPSESRLAVRFETEDGHRRVVYQKGELAQLNLAYATSIHKSQGSEYQAVVIVFLAAHYVMLSRNLLYTAVTRAKKLCVLVADPRALSIALGETRKEARSTGLVEQIRRL
jgi:exodeoxyribonuclease V alpha subunit